MAIEVHAVDVGGPHWESFLSVPVGVEARPGIYTPEFLAALLSGNLPLATGLTTQAFVALVSGRPAGRVVVQVDQRFPEKQVCQFGFFSCIDDARVAHQLTLAMGAWARSKGMLFIDGPIDINIFVGYRAQTSGFSTVPFTGEPRSPAYHRDLLEQAGFSPAHLYRSFDFDRSASEKALAYLAKKKFHHAVDLEGYSITPYDGSDLMAEVRRLFPLVMESFHENYGAVPLSAEEFVALYGPVSSMLSLEASAKVLKDGELVGFSMAYLDPTDAGILVGHSFGLKREHRKAGVAYDLVARALAASVSQGCHTFCGALSKDGPVLFEQFLPASRVYAVYRRHV